MRGYIHQGYINSFAHLDQQILFKECGGKLIQRKIPNTGYTDLHGTYPLFFCKRIDKINKDFHALSDTNHVSVVFVSDQINEKTSDNVREFFTICKPFKQHYITTLDKPWDTLVRRSMKRYANKAFRKFDFKLVNNNSEYSEILWKLFANNLKNQHGEESYRINKLNISEQLSIPGFKLFSASFNKQIHGIACYVEVGSKVYGHLIGCSDYGREHHVMYGLYGAALNYYYKKMECIDFGGNVGLKNDAQCGLSLFKSGWANRRQTVYLCGKILNHDLYEKLSGEKQNNTNAYFPAYRNS